MPDPSRVFSRTLTHDILIGRFALSFDMSHSQHYARDSLDMPIQAERTLAHRIYVHFPLSCREPSDDHSLQPVEHNFKVFLRLT